MRTKCCPNCEGDGRVLLMNSWFTSDGYRRERCGICAGTGRAPKNHRPWPGHASFLRTAKAHIAEWGGLKPIGRAALREAEGK